MSHRLAFLNPNNINFFAPKEENTAFRNVLKMSRKIYVMICYTSHLGSIVLNDNNLTSLSSGSPLR